MHDINYSRVSTQIVCLQNNWQASEVVIGHIFLANSKKTLISYISILGTTNTDQLTFQQYSKYDLIWLLKICKFWSDLKYFLHRYRNSKFLSSLKYRRWCGHSNSGLTKYPSQVFLVDPCCLYKCPPPLGASSKQQYGF